MHASDEERNTIHQNWDNAKDEGKSIALAVATLFKEECIYSIQSVDVSNNKGCWIIQAYVGLEDFTSLKDRYTMSFLGFHINFNDISTL